MKKNILILLFICVFLGFLSSCSLKRNKDDNKIKIVATVYPEYDWIKNIVKGKEDKIDLTLLVDNGIDMHSFQPSVDNIVSIKTADMIVYIGGESDSWVLDALKDVKNEKMVQVNLLKVLGDKAREEEIKEGMTEGEEEEEENAFDEHVFLSLKNAVIFCDYLTEQISLLDKENKDHYKSNNEDYVLKLKKLDKKYEEEIGEKDKKTIVVADRFPFLYLVKDYSIDYYAAFVGCSTDVEASFKTISFLAQKIDELSLKKVLVLESSDKKLAQTVITNTTNKDQSILVIDSMQSITRKDIDKGINYLEIMEKNLYILLESLS